MPLRALTPDNAKGLVPFVAMAAFSPGDEKPAGALEMPHVRRWLHDWGDELGVVWEDVGFQHVGRPMSGLLTMVWSAPRSDRTL